jgi:hypothetical protein
MEMDAITELKPKNQLKIMDQTGHLNFTWDAEKDDEIEEARKAFDEYRRKGYSAFRVRKGGERGPRIDSFDPDAEQMIMAPQLQGG